VIQPWKNNWQGIYYFSRFVDLNLSKSVPDHSTFWRFRNLLEKEGLFEVLLDEINAQLANQGAFNSYS